MGASIGFREEHMTSRFRPVYVIDIQRMRSLLSGNALMSAGCGTSVIRTKEIGVMICVQLQSPAQLTRLRI